MAGLGISELADLLQATDAEKNVGRYTSFAEALPDYPAAKQLMKKKRRQLDGGDIIRRQVNTGTTGSAKAVKMHEVDDVNISDTLKQTEIGWRFLQTDWAIELREIATNRDPYKIVDLKNLRRANAMLDMVELIENIFWGIQGEDDGRHPFSLLYWLQWNASEGFEGANNANFAGGPGGLDSTVYTGWKNYTATYVNVTKADLITDWRKAYRLCSWKNPVDRPDGMSKETRVNYMGYDTLAALETLGENANENLGRDLAPMDDRISFKGTPCEWVPQLDTTYPTSAPIFMLDWNVIFPVVMKGWYLKETAPEKAMDKHNTIESFVDLTMNLQCINRRKIAVLAKSDPMDG